MKVVDIESAGTVFDRVAESECLLTLFARLGVEEDVVEFVFDRVDHVDSLGRDGPMAVHTVAGIGAGQLTTPRTLDGGRRVVILFGLDIEAVGGSDLAIGGVSEDSDVAASDIGAATPAVVFLEDGLGDTLAGEMRRRALPEIRHRRRLRDVGAVGALADDITQALIGDLRGAVTERTPQRRGLVVAVGVGVEPDREMRASDKERDRPLALLPVDVELEAVVVVGDITDTQIVEFPAAEAGIPGDGEHRFVAWVVGVVDHRRDIALPVEHVRRRRRGVVRTTGRRRDPVEAVGNIIAVSEEFAELTECDAIVSVRLFVLVFAVDPRDDSLGSIAIVECVSQGNVGRLVGADAGLNVARHHATVADQLEMATIRVLPECQLAIELEERLLVAIGELVGVLDLLAIAFDATAGAFSHLPQPKHDETLNKGYNSRARTGSNCLGPTGPDAPDFVGLGELTPHDAIDSSASEVMA